MSISIICGLRIIGRSLIIMLDINTEVAVFPEGC